MSIPSDGGRNRPRVHLSPPPAWLQSKEPQAEVRPGSLPGWLKAGPGSGAVAPIQPPGWLSAALAGSQPPAAPAAPPPVEEPAAPPAPPADSLDALRPAPAGDDLFAALRAETTSPPVPDLPDWMAGPDDKPKTEPAAPDWMASLEGDQKPAERPMPDWMASLEGDQKPAEPAAPDWMASLESDQKPAERPMPDWMASLEEAKPAEPVPSAPMAEAKPPAADQGDMPDWMAGLEEAKPAEPAPATPVAEAKPPAGLSDTPDAGVPDWMAGLEEPKPAAPAPATPVAEARSAAEPGGVPDAGVPDAGMPDTDMPDWMAELGGEVKPAEPPSSPLPQTATYKPPPSVPDLMAAAESAQPGQEATSLPDWLAEGEAPPAESAPPASKTPGKSGLLGRLGPSAAPPVPGEPPGEAAPSGPTLTETPDWLADLEKADSVLAPPPAPAPAAAPDWLGDSSGQEKAGPPPAPDSVTAGDATDWLDQMMSDAPAPAAPASSEPAPGGDWLDGLGAPAAGPAAPVEMPDVDMPDAGVPDWLGGIGQAEAEPPAAEPAQPAEPARPAAPAPSLESPDWLEQLAKAEPQPSPPPAEPAAAPQEPAAPAPAAMPDWLGQIAQTEERPQPEGSANAGADAPDWLAQIAQTDAKPAEPTPAAPAESPDWLDQIAKTEAEPKRAEPSPESVVPAHQPAAPEPPAPGAGSPIETPDAAVPDWLNQLAAAAPSPGSTPPSAPAAPVETPDWLNQLAGDAPAPTPSPAPEASAPPAPKPAEPPAAETPAPAPVGDEFADLFGGMDLEMPAAGAAVGEDLLGLSGDLVPTPSTPAPAGEAEPAAPEDLPNWLSTMKAMPDQSEAGAQREATLPAESLGDLDDLRFDKLMGTPDAPPAPSPEKVGALKDVIGAIRPELIFDAQTLKTGPVPTDATVSPEQSRRIEMLEDLLAHKTEDVVAAGPGRSALPVTRWVVAVLLIAAVSAPLILKLAPLGAPSSASTGPADARDMLSKVAGSSTIVVAFDYEPDTSPELDPLALALLGKIAGQSGASVYAVSTRATGPALAQRAIDAVLAHADQAQRDRWVNLGYIPGGPNGITTLVAGSPPGLPSALSVNALGQPSGLSETSLTGLNPALIIVVTASAEDLEAWVEQAGRPTGIPVIAATSAGNMPMAAPYRQSRQVSALLSGVNDAVTFRALTGQPPDPAVDTLWNTQATGALVAALVILIGGAVAGLLTLRNHPEQGS